MFTRCKELEQLQHWFKERHIILLIFCFFKGKCWTRGNIFWVIEHGKHFSKRSAPGYMLSADLLKLFRIRIMARISHFVCLKNQLYHTYDLKCAEMFIFCTRCYFFSRFMCFSPPHVAFGNVNLCLCSWRKIILILISLYPFLLEKVMWQNNSHYVFLMLGDMAVDFNYISSFLNFSPSYYHKYIK